MGLLATEDWHAEWIGYTAGWEGRALYFRHLFDVRRPIKEARAYVAGLGYYELRLNGEKVGNHVLDPAWTDYEKRVLYVSYDVGPYLVEGSNVVGIIAGQGWFGTPRVKLQIEITYLDGTREEVATQGGMTASPHLWYVSGGPIIRNSIYDGETYDARLEKDGWNDLPTDKRVQAQDRTEGWTVTMVAEKPSGKLISQTLEPITVVNTFDPIAISEPRPKVYVFDTGRNLAGWVALKAEGEPGTRITLRYAEVLRPDGTVNQDNLRTAGATDVYVMKGSGVETWEPRFTYHGFRFVQIEGYPGKPKQDAVRIKVVRSNVLHVGAFSCGSELLNRIQQMVAATEESNLYGIPTDCPQRDERMGWLNDMTVRAEEGIYNFCLARLYEKWENDIEDTQDAAGAIADTAPFRWGKRPADPVSASYMLVAWLSYLHYGDVDILKNHYASFARWIDFLVSRSDNLIVDYSNYGDWAPPKAFAMAGQSGAGALSAGTPGKLMSTGFLYYQTRLLAQMAEVLGRDKDMRRLKALAERVKEAFDKKYWDEKVGGYGSNNQACNAFALFLGVVAEERRSRVVDNIVKDVELNGGHLTTGNLCTKYLLEMLSENDRADVAYGIATRTSYPSWGFMLENGATTLWERWEQLTGGGMNSHNHAMLGSVSSWLFKYVGGIQIDEMAPGLKRFIVRPAVSGQIGWASASYESLQGRIKSAWKVAGNGLTMNISVPVNTVAIVYVPGHALNEVREGGVAAAAAEGVKYLRTENGAVVFEVGSGDYEFTARLMR
jgi:alpha-L-rhamnosidase